MTGSLTFLSPWAALVALGALLPVAAFARARRRLFAVRRLLGLVPPRRRPFLEVACLALVPGLLGLAAAQPAIEHRAGLRVRTDAALFVMLDVSRSMLASAGPSGTTRLERAKADAIALRSALPDVVAGVGTMTDRALPNLLPTADTVAFDATVRDAIAIESPPPVGNGVRATSLGSLAQVPHAGFFPPSAKRRVLVVFTDGETGAYDMGGVARALEARPRTRLVLIRVWRAGEAIYDASGKRDVAYRPDPGSGDQLAALAVAAGGRLDGEGDAVGVARRVASLLGSGPTVRAGGTPRDESLAPYVALLALLPLALLAWRRRP